MSEQSAKRFSVLKLSGLALAMFAFAFWVMPPLYTLLCEVTGLRKVGGAYEAVENTVDTSRDINVIFIATQNHGLPWEFRPEVHRMTVHPGQKITVNYIAENFSRQDMIAQAVPSITPFNAVNYFHKIECFCFNHQPLAAGERAELGLQFVVDLELPAQVKTITLAYTLFDITERSREEGSLADANFLFNSESGVQ